MNRALRAATMGALLLTPVVLTACSAGQVNQTTSQDRDKVGPQAQIGDLQLRQVVIAHPCEAEGDEETFAYEQGDNPELTLSIVNTGQEDDTLTAVEGEAFDGVFEGQPPGEASPTTSAAPTTGAEPTETPGAETPGAETPGAETPGTPQAAPTAAASPSTRLDIPVPAGELLAIGVRQYEEGEPCEPDVAADTTRLFLADLDVDEPLTAGQTITVTLSFANAGDVTVPALILGPYGELERGEAYDFHGDEHGAESGDEQDTEAE